MFPIASDRSTVTLQTRENSGDLQQNSSFLRVKFCRRAVLTSEAKAAKQKSAQLPTSLERAKKAVRYRAASMKYRR